MDGKAEMETEVMVFESWPCWIMGVSTILTAGEPSRMSTLLTNGEATAFDN